jgi:hypothetical protein
MGRQAKTGIVGEDAVEQEMRDQEVLRATKELAAYFRGRRTEREARAALKIIKAFVRDRERTDPKNRRALPGSESTRATGPVGADRSGTNEQKGRRQSKRGQAQNETSKSPPGQEIKLVTNEAPPRDKSS